MNKTKGKTAWTKERKKEYLKNWYKKTAEKKRREARNAKILELRKKELTYEDISKILGISRQRVHRIEKRLIKT